MPAGYATTSTAISYALYEVARNPLLQQKVQEEVDMFGYNREPSFDYLSSFPYAEAVFLEGITRATDPKKNYGHICTTRSWNNTMSQLPRDRSCICAFCSTACRTDVTSTVACIWSV